MGRNKHEKKESHDEDDGVSEVKMENDDSDPLYVKYKDYLKGKYELTEKDKNKLGRVKEIQICFLDAQRDKELQKDVTKVDLSFFTGVKKIAGDFFAYFKLKELDVSAMKNVELINADSLFYAARDVKLLGAEVWKNTTITNISSGGYDWLLKEIDEGLVREVEEKRKRLIRVVNLISFKGKGRMGKLFDTEWVPKQLVANMIAAGTPEKVRDIIAAKELLSKKSEKVSTLSDDEEDYFYR